MDFGLTERKRDLVTACEIVPVREIAPNARLAWDEQRCPVEVLARLGKADLMGQPGRISMAALSNSLTKAVLRLALDYACDRPHFGAPTSSLQVPQFKLGDIAMELEASRWLTYRDAAVRDSGAPLRRKRLSQSSIRAGSQFMRLPRRFRSSVVWAT